MSATNLAQNPTTTVEDARGFDSANPAALVRAAADADADAWAAIVRRYTKTVHRIARAHRLGEADAADVAQTVWLQLLQHIDEIRNPERVGGWVATTARNECLRHYRQRARLTLVGDDALETMWVEPQATPAVECADRDAALRGALDSLPPRQRAILDLLMADPPASYDEVAANLDIPIGSIGPTRQRSLKALRLTCLAAGILPD